MRLDHRERQEMICSIRPAIVLLATVSLGAWAGSNRNPEGGAAQPKPIPVPALTGRINDTVGALSLEDQEHLSKLLKGYEQETKHQIAVLIVPTIGDEAIESFSFRTFSAWRLGRKGIDDGILVCLAMKEKRVRIALGTGMERYISNAEAKEIIDTEMTPFFGISDFAEGLERGLKRLMEEGRRFVARNSATAVEYDRDWMRAVRIVSTSEWAGNLKNWAHDEQ